MRAVGANGRILSAKAAVTSAVDQDAACLRPGSGAAATEVLEAALAVGAALALVAIGALAVLFLAILVASAVEAGRRRHGLDATGLPEWDASMEQGWPYWPWPER